MTTYIPRHEQKAGSDLSGSSEDKNRTYVLTNDNAILANMQILIARAILQPVSDFTLDTDTNTITFLNAVWDDQVISIDYWTSSTAASGDTYCTTLQIARFAGMGVEIMLEELGTGDSSETSFDSDNGNILTDSYSVKYGASGDNDLNTMSEGSDYTIYKDDGRILLTSAGVTKLGTDKLYISYTYSPNLSDTLLNTYLAPAAREVEKLTQNYFGSVKTSIEYFDGYTNGYPGTQLDNLPEFELSNQSVQSITSVQYLDNTGDVDSTVDSDYISLDEDGRVILTSSTVPNGKRNVKITYTHGYTSIPAQVQELAAMIGGVMALVCIGNGSYDAVTSYTLSSFSATVGEQYVNIKEVINQSNKRIATILTNLGGNYSCA